LLRQARNDDQGSTLTRPLPIVEGEGILKTPRMSDRLTGFGSHPEHPVNPVEKGSRVKSLGPVDPNLQISFGQLAFYLSTFTFYLKMSIFPTQTGVFEDFGHTA